MENRQNRNKNQSMGTEKPVAGGSPELLAPAGSVDALRAAFIAGADAVYIGGDRFGARAYADNPGQQDLLACMDLAHRLGKKLYLTVNTLLKDEELEDELYPWMLPYVREGLDGVIIQDFGAVRLFQHVFPTLPLHASTQMTVTGWRGAAFLKQQGFSRVVPARELSLEEIREIQQQTGMEVETFIHGAMCYAYSGQCLFSSFLGGRSGNRGRCAGICRLPFQVYRADSGFHMTRHLEPFPGTRAGREAFPMNMKDMCTVEILPDLLRAGICSLKIEGRMKKPEYTAGVVSVYRKYLDILREDPDPESWKVEREDLQFLWDLFNRDGFCKSYYFEKNGRDMVALKNEKLDHVRAQAAQAVTDQLRSRLSAPDSRKRLQAPVSGKLLLREGCARLTLGIDLPAGDGTGERRHLEVSLEREGVQRAQNQPVSEQRVRTQMNKTGGSSFCFSSLDIHIEGELFVPMSLLNELRRDGFARLEEQCRALYHREIRETAGESLPDAPPSTGKMPSTSRALPVWAAAETLEQAGALAALDGLAGIYLPAAFFLEPDQLEPLLASMRRASSLPGLALPFIARKRQEREIVRAVEAYLDQTEGQPRRILVRNLEEAGLVRGLLQEKGLDTASCSILDSGIQTMNTWAEQWFLERGFPMDTVSPELSSRELRERDNSRSELVVYGRTPLMFSQQCFLKTLDHCTHRREHLLLRDRKNVSFPVRCDCGTCTNIIYNSLPLSLLGQRQEVCGTGCRSVRLCFTTEDGGETRRTAEAFIRVFSLKKEEMSDDGAIREEGQTTRGHFHRGVL